MELRREDIRYYKEVPTLMHKHCVCATTTTVASSVHRVCVPIYRSRDGICDSMQKVRPCVCRGLRELSAVEICKR